MNCRLSSYDRMTQQYGDEGDGDRHELRLRSFIAGEVKPFLLSTRNAVESTCVPGTKVSSFGIDRLVGLVWSPLWYSLPSSLFFVLRFFLHYDCMPGRPMGSMPVNTLKGNLCYVFDLCHLAVAKCLCLPSSPGRRSMVLDI